MATSQAASINNNPRIREFFLTLLRAMRTRNNNDLRAAESLQGDLPEDELFKEAIAQARQAVLTGALPEDNIFAGLPAGDYGLGTTELANELRKVRTQTPQEKTKEVVIEEKKEDEESADWKEEVEEETEETETATRTRPTAAELDERYRRTDINTGTSRTIARTRDGEIEEIIRSSDPSAVWREEGIDDKPKEFRERAKRFLADSPGKKIAQLIEKEDEQAYLSQIEAQRLANEARLKTVASDAERLKILNENSKLKAEERIRSQMAKKDEELKRDLEQLIIEKKRDDLGLANNYTSLTNKIAANRAAYTVLNRQYNNNAIPIPVARKTVNTNNLSTIQQLSSHLGGVSIGGVSNTIQNATKITPLQIDEINRRVKDNIARHDPLHALGLNARGAYDASQIKKAYAQTLKALSASTDPESLPLLENFQKKYGSFIDSIDILDQQGGATIEKDVNKLVKQYTLANRLQEFDESVDAIKNEYVDNNFRDIWDKIVSEKRQGSKEFRDKGRAMVKKAGLYVVGGAAMGVGYVGKKVAWEMPRGAARLGYTAGAAAYNKAKTSPRLLRFIQPTENAAIYVNRKTKPARQKARSLFSLVKDGALGFVRNAVETVKDGVRGVQTISRLASPARLMTNVQARLFTGASGRVLINAARALRGANGVLKALPHGMGTATMAGLASLILTGGISAPVVAGAFVTGTGVRLLERTLASNTPHFYKPIADMQYRYGNLRVFGEGPLPQGHIRGLSRFHMGLKSVNSGFYGFTAGTIIASLMGFNPVLGGVLGAAGFMGGRYLTEATLNNLAQRQLGSSFWINTASKMPFTSVVGVAMAVPWLKYQYEEFKRLGAGEYLNQEWLSMKGALNALQGIGFITSTIQTGAWLMAARAGSLPLIGGTIIGMGAGMLVAPLIGIPVGVGFVVGGVIGGAIGFVIGGFLGPVGALIGSAIGSFVGSVVGGWIDKITGGAENALAALSYLNAIKSFMDFFSGLFDNSKNLIQTSLSFVIFLIFSGPAFFAMLDMSSTNDSSSEDRATASTSASAQTNKPQVAGETITRTTITCAPTQKYLINPQTTILTRITQENGLYTLETRHNIFTGILRPSESLEVSSTVTKGKIMGYCN